MLVLFGGDCMASSLSVFRNGNFRDQKQRISLSRSVPGGVLRRYSKDLNTIQKISDSLIAGISLWLISVILNKPWGHLEQAISLFAALLVALLANRLSIYKSFRDVSHWTVIRRVMTLWLCLVGAVTSGLFTFKIGSQVSREQLLIWLAAYALYLSASHLASRQLLRQLRLHGRNTRCDGYIGSEEGLLSIQYHLSNANWLGHRVQPEFCWPENRPPSQKQIEEFCKRLEQQPPDQWLVEEPKDPVLLNQLLSYLQDQHAPVLLIPRWLSDAHCEPRYCQLGSIGALELWGHSEQATPLQLSLKHALDRLTAGAILIAISPILAIIAIAIRLDSQGPILFNQKRYGLNSKPFGCFKFRTMLTQDNGNVVIQATRDDPRITRVGSFLRRWNLDELPQLFNILKGEMSLVGPRPHAAAHNEYYRNKIKAYMRRHSLRPGLTGWAQVQGLRGETDTIDKMEARINADIEYIRNWNLALDIKIFLMTLVRWRNKNAY
jgi:putative colanic acid biosynthesis UDP-glucose lipid carrier transferase